METTIRAISVAKEKYNKVTFLSASGVSTVVALNCCFTLDTKAEF